MNRPITFACRAWRKPGRMLMLALAVVAASPVARALEEAKEEKEQLKACEERICAMAIKREATGEDLKCALSKTWQKSKIKEGIEKKKMDWSLGDARCKVAIDVKREMVVGALTKPAFSAELPKTTVNCEVEREKEITAVNISLAPKIQFKDGKAEKAWLGVGEIEAPAVIKGALWTAAKIEDTFGLFHSELIKEINEFLHEKCAHRYKK